MGSCSIGAPAVAGYAAAAAPTIVQYGRRVSPIAERAVEALVDGEPGTLGAHVEARPRRWPSSGSEAAEAARPPSRMPRR